MPLDCELLNELLEELWLLFELLLERVCFLACSWALKEFDLILLNQGAELLDADENLGDELCNFGFFPAEHRLVQDLVEVLIVYRYQIFKYLDASKPLIEALPSSINSVDHDVLLKSACKTVHRCSEHLNCSDLLGMLLVGPFELRWIQSLPAFLEQLKNLLDLEQSKEDPIIFDQWLLGDDQI